MKPLSLTCAMILLAGCTPAGSTTWYVDYQAGSDQADGKSPKTAWKHAPGDLKASGGPASVNLQPGDVVQFKGGVSYFSTIRMKHNGTPEKPITYTGLGWGEGMGIIEGGNPVKSVTACTSAAQCGGTENWQGLSRIEYDQPTTSRITLFGEKGLYYQTQFPTPPDRFFYDNWRHFRLLPKPQLEEIKKGIVKDAALAKAVGQAKHAELIIWVFANQVERRPVLSVSGDEIRFDPEGLKFQTQRDNAIAVSGVFGGLEQDGNFMMLQPGVLLARLRPEDKAGSLMIGDGRNGILLAGVSNVKITGFRFRNFVGSRHKSQEGVAMWTRTPGSENLMVGGNYFGPSFMENRKAAVQVSGTRNFRLLANRFEDLQNGSALRATKDDHNFLAEGNYVRRIGRTGITFFGTRDSVARGNILVDVRGTHGNAISAYLGNSNLLIEGNCAIMSSRPMTFHGNRTPDVPTNLTIRNNIFLSDPDGQGGLLSWGASTNGVIIENNVAVGRRSGILLNKSDLNVRVTGNQVSRIGMNGGEGQNWTVKDNREGLTLEQVYKTGEFSEAGCYVPAVNTIRVTRTQFSE